MGKKRKERTVAELYKRTVKLLKPRITPILEGHCRIQGPLNESDSESETKRLRNTADRDKEKDSSIERMESSVSTNVSKRRRNKEQETDHNTVDTILMQKKTPGKESPSEHATGKSASKDFVEREEIPGSKKTRISSNVRRAKGNKSRKASVASSHSDRGQEVELQASSMIEPSEKSLETPGSSQTHDEEKILFLGKQSEETCDQSRNSGTSSSHSDYVQKAETQATDTIEQSEKRLETLDASQARDEEKMLSIDKQSEETCDTSNNAAIPISDSDYEQKAEIQESGTIEQSEMYLETSFASQSNEETILSLGKQLEETSYKSGFNRQNEEVQATCMTEQIEKSLEAPSAAQSNDEGNILSLENQFEETRDKCFDKEPADILQSNETTIVVDAAVNKDDKGIKKQEEADEELPVTKPSDTTDINSEDSHCVGVTLSQNSLNTCSMAPITVSDEINELEVLTGIQSPVSLHSDLDVHAPGSENSSGMAQIHFNGDACNNKDLTERPLISNSPRLENTDELISTSTESLVTENVILKGTSASSDMANAENMSSLESPEMHFEKTSSSSIEGSLDVIQKAETESKGSEFLQQNNNIQIVTPTTSNVEEINTFAENSLPGHSLNVDGTETVNLPFKSGPLDHSLSSSPEKKEVSNILFSEDNILQEAVSSFPLSVIPGHSSLISASMSVKTEKEIEAYSSNQQEQDFAFTSSTVCTEFSTNKNTIIDKEEAKDVLPVLPVAARSAEHLENNVLKRNELDQDFQFCEGSKKLGPSELASSSGVSFPCGGTEKSCVPLSGEDDVKVCDICGNTGYEEMLAVCSVCNDGAEHIYCMQTMLDEVPERDWLCEGCKSKQDINVKRVETSTSLTVISKPACLNSRKHSYGTARSRLSAKLDKKKLVPERKRAFKGIPSSLLSTKRQAESFEIGPATKKLALGTPSSNIGSFCSNPKSIFHRENSFKALDIGKVKTSIAVSSTGDLPSSSVHDSGKSSTLYGASSPRLPVSAQLSKNRLLSLNSRMTDSSVVTGSKAGRNAPSTHSVKVSADSSTPLRSNSFYKLSATPKDVKEPIEVGSQAKADRENTSNSHAAGVIAKPLKCNTSTDLSTVSDPKTSSGVHNLETKEIRTGKLAKDGLGLAKKKAMSKSPSICRDSKSALSMNLEKPAVDDRHAKSVTFLMKDSPNSRPVRSEVKMAVAPRQVALNSNKELNSLRFLADGREGRTQLKTSPSKFQAVTANKLQHSASTEASHKVTAEKSEDKSLFETTFVIKSSEEENIFTSSVKDEKMSNSLGEKLAAEGRASQNEKKSATLANKLISNDLLLEENKKSGNFKKFSSLKWASPNHQTAAGSTRCYKCKELGHSAQLCTSRTSAETGSSGLRVSSLIASAARSAKDLSDTVSVKINTLEEITSSGNYKASGNDESSVLQLFNSEQDHADQPGSGSPGQVSSNKEASYRDPKCNSVESSKGASYLSRELDIKTLESCQVSIPTRDLGQGLATTTPILTSGLGEPSLVNPSSNSSKSQGEQLLHTAANEKKKLGNDEIQKNSSQLGQIVSPTEDMVVAIRESLSHGVPASLDGAGQPGIECRSVPCRGSSVVETTSASSLPEHNFLWQGGFDVQSNTNGTNYFDGIQAHASTSAASKVLDAVKKFSSKLQLEEVPRYSSWPLQFGHYRPSDKNIALYFFAKDHESYERPYRKLLEHMLKHDLALRGNFDGVELLVFSSNQLEEQSQRWNRLLFLWGVFRERKSTCIESSTCMNENVQGELAKGDPSASSVFGSSELEVMDTDRVVIGDSNVSEGTLRVTGDQTLASTSSQDEGPNGNSYDPNIQNLPVVEDTKFNSTLKIDKKDAEQLSIKKHSMGSSFESNEQSSSKIPQSNRLSSPDLSAGLEISTTQMPQNATDGNFFEEMIPPEAGLVASGKSGEISSSHIQTEGTKPNCLRHTLSASSTISLSSTERKAYSCDTLKTAHFQSDSLGQQTSIDKGKKRPRDAKCDRQMEKAKEVESARLSSRDGEMDQGWRPWEKHREDSLVANERERGRCPSISREEDYGNCEPKYQKDGMQQRKRFCPSRSHSPPQIGVQSHSQTKQIFKNDFEYSQTHSPNLDHIKQPLRWQASEMIPDFDGSSHEKSKNIVVDGKDGRRKLKSYSNVEVQENGKKQDVSNMNLAEQKMSSRQSYPIADLNQVADFDSAVEFSGTSVQQHIQQEDPEGHLRFPQYCQLTERVFFPFSDDISRNHRLSKLSEQWPSQLGSKQSSSESSSTSRLISSTEENWERLDLNMPSLELDLGGRVSSNPIKSSPLQGTENGSSLALSLAYPLTQNDQTTKTQKEDYKKPVNCSVNASFCLFGHRVNG
ncbi:hypothetical protein SUGI_0802960 [Cryptomeria japonica]|uniref:uncharacterized protein LOC131031181 n=1 Tax=Cryptomeria japonica TaxID=3369 RepID=UPI0024148655|nr:uncharacterized protein LOC131031181 [Cryptomeria japonica]GLJ39331.1 hypothetical protein SUGI_0802960 [Cryptomeria japonica]